MPTLADLYSAINTAKRKGADFLQNPGTSLQQMLGDANDRARQFNEATANAANATLQSGSFNNPESMALASQIAAGYNPAGMVGKTLATKFPSATFQELPKDYYELTALANEAYTALRKTPSKELKDKYLAITEAREAAANNPSKNYVLPTPDVPQAGYKGEHSAPISGSGKPLHDLTDIYPADFYSFDAPRLYGHGQDLGRDTRVIRQLQTFKDRPDRPVTIYRAVPKDMPKGTNINQGDWVTTDRQYAIEHGIGALNNDYKIISKSAKARDLFTNGDSIYELGYDPQPYIPRSQR